jgi:hypothetical protein
MPPDDPACIADGQVVQRDRLVHGTASVPGQHGRRPAAVKRACQPNASALPRRKPEGAMSIDKQSEIAANLQIGPTTLGMVRIYIEGEGIELPLDFEPEEAEEIAEELLAAAKMARSMEGGAPAGGRRKK